MCSSMIVPITNGTPQNFCCLKDETSPSYEESTPSPVAVRYAQEAETTIRSASKDVLLGHNHTRCARHAEPADSANLFVKNFDEDIISDPNELKRLFELYRPVASAHLSMIPGTNRSI
ncbi:hypothetical protein B9Z19DRAFT_1064785 [Tuber borchii]|uniref:Uncharacterized protein n=1 Tax=Tuber borchii TaxID=42251 RepID=A0A2T6ZTF2_TUBBO|nr:hypothetical protein B9Z19DRAFT_1064785 [Tuber borchii]